MSLVLPRFSRIGLGRSVTVYARQSPRQSTIASYATVADDHSQREVAVGPSSPLPPSSHGRVPSSPALTRLLQAGERPVPLLMNPQEVDLRAYELVPGQDPSAALENGGKLLYRALPPDLPHVKSKFPKYALFAAGAIASWVVFLNFSSNRLKYNTSGPYGVLTITSPTVREALGSDVNIIPTFLHFGMPRITGTVDMLHGLVDVSFPISGILGNGVVFFTSIRRTAKAGFEIIRWKVVKEEEDGTSSEIDLTREIASS